MLDAVEQYVAYVKREAVDGELHIETRVRIDVDEEELFGTSDAFIVYPKARRVVIIDFKYGKGVIVVPTARSS